MQYGPDLLNLNNYARSQFIGQRHLVIVIVSYTPNISSVETGGKDQRPLW